MTPFLRVYLSDFKSNFLQVKHYDYNPQYRERYVLGCLNTEISKQAGLTPLSQENIQKLQIEHILPQTLTNLDVSNEFNEEERDKYTAMLGNTTLLESQINQAINNHNDLSTDWFGMKQAEYIHSSFVLTKLLNDEYTIGKNTGLNRLKNKLTSSLIGGLKHLLSKDRKY
ncbi:MAG: HNH endonuclease family protein [Psychrobacter nivimaris]